MEESSIYKTMKADTAEQIARLPPSDAETSGKAEACDVVAENVPDPAAEEKKKKTKVMRFRMTP